MKEIYVKYSDRKAIVDDEDFERLSKYKWYLNRGYIQTRINGKTAFIHRIVNNTPDGLETDHINRDTFLNTKDNLRTVTPKQNSANKGKYKNNTTGYEGITKRKDRVGGKIYEYWRVRVGSGNNVFASKSFKNINDAIVYREQKKQEFVSGVIK